MKQLNSLATLLSSMAEIYVFHKTMTDEQAQDYFLSRIQNVRITLSRRLDKTWDDEVRALFESISMASLMTMSIREFVSLRMDVFCQKRFANVDWRKMPLHELREYGFETDRVFESRVMMRIPLYLVPVFPKGVTVVHTMNDEKSLWQGTEEIHHYKGSTYYAILAETRE